MRWYEGLFEFGEGSHVYGQSGSLGVRRSNEAGSEKHNPSDDDGIIR